MSPALGNHDRMLANLIMVGVVVELDEALALVRVNCDGMLSDFIPWAAGRAGPGVRTWTAPEIGEQVIVVCPYGDLAQGVVLGSIYQSTYAAAANAATLHRAIFSDGTVVEYDRTSHLVKVDVGSGRVVINCAAATVTASESVTLDTPSARITGDVTVDGKISAGGDITTSAEVKAGSIGLKAHHHTAQGATAPTTPAQA